MSQEIVKFKVNNPLSLENTSDVKEEFRDVYYPDNKICISETTINISNTELNEYMQNDKIRKYEMVSADHIKTDIPSEVNIVSSNTKIENGVYPVNIQDEYPICTHCQEVCQDYCTKCRVLVHILNERPCLNTYNIVKELPTYMLEARESIGHLRIFTLKVIPEDVRFGPFTGLSTGLSLKIKGGRFVCSDDKLECLNWMQYINPAKNIYEQNLFPFQYDDKLYYCSTRRIQESEELLVYFGEEYEDNLLQNVEMDFLPIIKKDVGNVFACISCCLGFSSKKYLAEHKTVSHGETNETFSVEELEQCPFCKIYLEAKEYFEHHMDYCSEANYRYSIPPTPESHKLDVKRRSSLRSKAKRQKRRIYKCTQCKFSTMYYADFRCHTNQHCEVKMYKCGICDRRYKAKEYLKTHVEKIHPDNEGTDVQKYSTRDYFKATIKNIKERCPHSHVSEKPCQSLIKIKRLNKGRHKCPNCEFKTCYRTYLEAHMKMVHLMKCNYKCAECQFETDYKSSLERHMKARHLEQKDYKCTECEYKANRKSHLEKHIKIKHLKQTDYLKQVGYKCLECEFETYYKASLEKHIKGKHLKQNDYKCMECEYKTNCWSYLQVHIKTKHLKVSDYKCMECEYNTNYKSHLKTHIKTKHLKLKDYKCIECEYETSNRSHLRVHIKRKHVKVSDYKCMECEYETNHKPYLKKHLKAIHLKVSEYKCMECEYETSKKSYLQVHIKTKHLNVHDYKCMECEYKTNHISHLKAHLKIKHLKQKDYKCKECEYKTFSNSQLKIHIKAKHLKRKDYKCAECEYETSDKSYLQVHIKAKHLNVSNFKCIECEYKANYKSQLEKHIKIKHLKEMDYKCVECEFKTQYKSNLETHIKTKHLKVSDYKCMECEYQTNYKSKLERHIKIKHLKQMVDYKCTECDFKTNYKSNLGKHIKSKHLKV